jgi:hypothetical protein
MSAPRAFRRWAAVLVGLLAAGPTLPGQEPSRPFPEQTTVFRRILFEDSFKPLTSFDDLDADSILIVLGNTEPLARLALRDNGLAGFVRAGGAVLIATDRPLDIAQIDPTDNHPQEGGAAGQLKPFGVRLGDGFPTWKEVEQAQFYHGHSWCPLVQPQRVPSTAPALFQPFNLPLAGMLPAGGQLPELQVATNAPGYLESLPRPTYRLHELARLPSRSGRSNTQQSLDEVRKPGLRWYDPQDLAEAARGQKAPRVVGPLFAVGGDVGDQHGRILVLADHSIFSNGMIYRLDNRNLEFTSQSLRWLQEGGPQPRMKVLLLDDGWVVPSFEVHLRAALPLPKPSEQAVVAAIDETLAGMEDRNALDGGLYEFIQTRLPGGMQRLYRGTFLAATLLLFIYGCYRIGIRSLHRRDVQVPLLSEAVAEHRPHATLPVLRQRAMHQAGNAWEAARAVARQCLVDLAPAEADDGPPRFVVAGSTWRRWRRQSRLRWLWRLAYDPTPVPIAPERLPALVAELLQVQEDLRSGVIRVE